MRVKRTLYNSIYAIVAYAIIGVLGLVLRKFFLVYLPTEYLGYEGLFYDIFSILSIADLGIAGIIQYKLFPAITNQKEEEVSKLMAVYKILYRIVGCAILLIGVILVPFLKFIIKDNSLRWSYVYVVYFLQLAATLCNYFLAYKRIMIVAHMRESEITKIETACSFASYVVKIAVILLTRSYILYLTISILNNIIANAIIAHKVNKDYPYIRVNTKITRQDIKELGIGNDLKNNVVQKICMAIYGGTDSILISSLIGIAEVGLLSTYKLISSQISNVLTKLLNPFQASIANYVYSEDVTDHEGLFKMFDRLGFFMACFISTSFLVLYNPFIELLYGEQFLMSFAFVICFVINQYITYAHKFLCFYRGSFGRFELDKTYTFVAAMLNLILSIVLAKPMGIAGIMLGTAIGHMGFWIGRARVVYTEYMKEPVIKYVTRQIANAILCTAECALTYYICSFFPKNWGGFALMVLMCLLIPNVLNFIIFFKTKDMKMMFEYTKKTINSVRSKKGGEE